MKITNASFIASIEKLRGFPGRGMPEIAMAGRSNVGKSSLINKLCNNSHLARVSGEPGKTRMVNLYKVGSDFILTDLPGYGFAKVSGAEKQRWTDMIEGYLSGSEFLRHVLLLVDIRHEPTDDDRLMAEYLRSLDIPFSVLATKADKLSKAQISRSIPVICRKLVVQPWQVIAWSSESGQGRDELLKRIDQILHPKKQADIGIVIPEGITIDDGPTREQP